ncbi:MAG: hypothetical protein ACYTGH_21035 [Planctomycetota bacterium]
MESKGSPVPAFSKGLLSFGGAKGAIGGDLLLSTNVNTSPLAKGQLQALSGYLPGNTHWIGSGTTALPPGLGAAPPTEERLTKAFTNLPPGHSTIQFEAGEPESPYRGILVHLGGGEHRFLATLTHLAQDSGGTLRPGRIAGRDILYGARDETTGEVDFFAVSFFDDVMLAANTRDSLAAILQARDQQNSQSGARAFLQKACNLDQELLGVCWGQLSILNRLYPLVSLMAQHDRRSLGWLVLHQGKSGTVRLSSFLLSPNRRLPESGITIISILGWVLVAPFLAVGSILAVFIVAMGSLCIFYLLRSRLTGQVYAKTIPDPATLSVAMRRALGQNCE